MYSARPPERRAHPGPAPLTVLAAAFLLLAFTVAAAQAGRGDRKLDIPPVASPQEAWLVTYAPGEIYWQRFGHNAIWLREPATGLDHTFNFGYFDFEQENFLLNFARGRMMYFALAQRSEREFAQYLDEDRSISLQKLDLPAGSFDRLKDYLVAQVQPETRDYRYDYYLENCSTRVRDALDMALGGALYRATGETPARQTFREQTRRSAALDFWYYLGLEAALAKPVDRDISRWDEMFMPNVVAEEVQRLAVDGAPVVVRDWTVFKGNAPQPPDEPVALWWRYLLFSSALAAFSAGLGRKAGPALAGGMALAWLLLNATGGAVLLWLWLFTDHQVAVANANLLLLNPLFLAGLFPVLRRFTAWLMGAAVLAAIIQAAWSGGQYTQDVLAFVLPLNAACIYWLWGRRAD